MSDYVFAEFMDKDDVSEFISDMHGCGVRLLTYNTDCADSELLAFQLNTTQYLIASFGQSAMLYELWDDADMMYFDYFNMPGYWYLTYFKGPLYKQSDSTAKMYISLFNDMTYDCNPFSALTRKLNRFMSKLSIISVHTMIMLIFLTAGAVYKSIYNSSILWLIGLVESYITYLICKNALVVCDYEYDLQEPPLLIEFNEEDVV